MDKEKILDRLVLNKVSLTILSVLYLMVWVLPYGLYLYIRDKIKGEGEDSYED